MVTSSMIYSGRFSLSPGFKERNNSRALLRATYSERCPFNRTKRKPFSYMAPCVALLISGNDHFCVLLLKVTHIPLPFFINRCKNDSIEFHVNNGSQMKTRSVKFFTVVIGQQKRLQQW